jgi:hypothetical protein
MRILHYSLHQKTKDDIKNIYAHKSCNSKAQNMTNKVYNLECVSVNDLHLDTQCVKPLTLTFTTLVET